MLLQILADGAGEWAVWIAPALTLIVSGGLVVVGYFALKRKRLMQNVPTSKVKGVFIGLNELKGMARIEAPLRSYLAEEECIWYSYVIKEQWRRTTTTTDSEGKTKTVTRSGWTTIDSEEQRKAFRLEDDTGEIRVLPDKAEFIGDRVVYETVNRFSDIYFGKGPPMEIADSTGRRSFSESMVRRDTNIYLLGSARVREDLPEPEIAHDPVDKVFLVSSKDEATLTLRYSLINFFSFLGGLLAIVCFPLALSFALTQEFNIGTADLLLAILAAVVYGLVISGLYFSLIYNGLVSVMNRVHRAWSLIEIQLQRRFDLIPKIVECAKGFMEHETELQAGLAGLRTTGALGQEEIPSGDAVASQAAATNSQTATLGRFFALAEDYPEIKANTVFLKLNEQLVDTEDRISLARQFFNDSVTAYNDRIQKLPDVVFAKVFKYRAAELYQIQDFQRAAVKINLDNDPPPPA